MKIEMLRCAIEVVSFIGSFRECGKVVVVNINHLFDESEFTITICNQYGMPMAQSFQLIPIAKVEKGYIEEEIKYLKKFERSHNYQLVVIDDDNQIRN